MPRWVSKSKTRSSIALLAACAFCFAALPARADGRLGVYDAWIRAAPPGADMMAGYATLKNEGDAPLSILTVQSDAFRQSSIHETIVERGVVRMRETPRIDLAPGAGVAMKPGGAHIMLMYPRHAIAPGDKVEIVFLLADGRRVDADFDVLAPDAMPDDQGQ